MKTIAILGSTGSIGTQTLDVVRANGDIQVAALAAGKNIKLLEQQIREFHPRLAAVADEAGCKGFKDSGQRSRGRDSLWRRGPGSGGYTVRKQRFW